MTSSFEELFGRSYKDCHPEDLPKHAEAARQAGTWVTAQCQHRWFLLARALLETKTTRKSALNDSTELWDMLGTVTEAVGLIFTGVSCNALHALYWCPRGMQSCNQTNTSSCNLLLQQVVSQDEHLSLTASFHVLQSWHMQALCQAPAQALMRL